MCDLMIKMAILCRWVMMMMVVVVVVSCSGCWEQEKIALLHLKANLNYPNGNSLISWVDEDTVDCCQWEGVECNTTTWRVTGLSLNSTRQSWMLGDWNFNASLFLSFKELKKLHLVDNSIAGWVENEGFDRLKKLSNLEVLDLYDNKLNNSILSSLSELSSLKSLYLGANQLKESTHNSFGRLSRLSNLEVLDLSGNELNNSLLSYLETSGISRLSTLEVLDLSYNDLNNSVFSSLRGFLSLKSLHIRGNQLKGSIHLEGLRNMEELDLSWNEVDSISRPQGIENSSKLKVLWMGGGQFSLNGSRLLESLGAFPSLRILDLEYCYFNRTITTQDLRNLSKVEEFSLTASSVDNSFLQSIGVMTSLRVLSLTHCGLNSSLPVQGLCELKNLQVLDLSYNEFEGTIPSCDGNLTSLRMVDLSFNEFSGNIAQSPLTSPTSLEYLAFLDNHFHVPLSFFANHSKLEVFLGDNNKLIVEPVFDNWAPMFQLKTFSFAGCSLNLNFPNFLFYQYDLRFVDLSHNNLAGRFPSWLLENNTRLETLGLSNNTFIGPLNFPSNPNPNFLRIDISKNNIEEQIPTNLSSIFPNLKFLNMSRNSFYGNIIFCFNDMHFLDVLDLSNNNLSGIIPEHLMVGCPSLWFLKLSNNSFHGQISPKMSSHTSLKFLYLNGNNFTGEVPSSLSTMFLSMLDVSNNHLSGEIPRWIGNMSSSITGIAMSKNHFQGHIPTEFCNFQQLSFLDLSNNNLSGSIPSCINQSTLSYLHLQKNSLQGPLTCEFDDNSSLVILDLTENHFSGKIPNWIGRLSMLSILLLRDNHFKGEIPIEICQVSTLSIMDLSRNNLSGPIPPCLSNITSMKTQEISIVSTLYLVMKDAIQYGILPYKKTPYFAGMQYSSFTPDNYQEIDVQEQVEFTTKWRSDSYKGNILNFMSGIDLSCNQLTGEIPNEFGNLSKIHALNLSHNSLNGSIPTTLSNLRQLESLDLSYNNLNGRIPPQLIELTSLEVFCVAQNNLSGPTPEMKAQFATFDASSYEGNRFLCGAPLHNDCTKIESPSTIQGPLDGKEDDTRFIDMGVFYVSFAVSYIIVLLGIVAVLYINPYWRRVWFYLVELCITTGYYFVLDNFPKFSNFKNL